MYVVAAAISERLPGFLCIKRKQETNFCWNFVPEEMADCYIALLNVMPTSTDANLGFYSKFQYMTQGR